MKKDSFLRNSLQLMVLTFFLKIVGFINRMVIAYYYGTSTGTDMYYSAAGFVEGVADIILSGLTTGIVSIYARDRDRNSRMRFVSNVVITMEGILLFFTATVFCFADEAAKLLAPSYSAQMLDDFSRVLRIMCFAIPFMGLFSTFSAMLQAEKRFVPVKLTNTITSLASIVCVVFGARQFGNYALIIAFFMANICNSTFLRIGLKEDFSFAPGQILKDQKLKEMIRLSFPLMIACAGMRVNLMVDKSVATGLVEGAVTALSYGSVLYLFIENIVINSTNVAVFPEMANAGGEGDDKKVARTAKSTLLLTEFILLPIVFCFYYGAEAIVRTAYMRGNFDQTSFELTCDALRGYVVGLPFLAVRDIVTRVYYTYGDTRFPVIVNLAAVGINIFLDFYLSRRYGIIGITLATAVSIIFTSAVLYICVGRYNRDVKFVMRCKPIAVWGVSLVIQCWLGKKFSYGRGIFFTGFALLALFVTEIVTIRIADREAFAMGMEKIKKHLGKITS